MTLILITHTGKNLSNGEGFCLFDYMAINLNDDNEIISEDVSEQRLEKLARGYFVGSQAVGRKKDIRQLLENRVVQKIGGKGKYLVDKLFELIDGVYMVDRLKEVKGKEEVRYYKVPPNLNAIIYALDRVLGKPKQLSIQGSFSLSKLLISSDNGNEFKPRSTRSGSNEKIHEESSLLYQDNLES